MTSKECEEQLQRLLYDWETEGLLTKLNATDIKAIKHLMLENQMQQDVMIKYKNENLNLQEEIKELSRMCELYSKSLYNAELTQLKKRIDIVSEKIENYTTLNPLRVRKELLEILRGKDENNN